MELRHTEAYRGQYQAQAGMAVSCILQRFTCPASQVVDSYCHRIHCRDSGSGGLLASPGSASTDGDPTQEQTSTLKHEINELQEQLLDMRSQAQNQDTEIMQLRYVCTYQLEQLQFLC